VFSQPKEEIMGGCSRTKFKIDLLRMGSILALSASVSLAAAAQEDEEVVLQTVTVTPLQYETSFQETPISMTTFDAELIESAGVIDIQDVQYLVPSTHIADWYGQTMVTIRGIGNDVVAPGAEPGVAVYQDGVYLSRRYYMGGAFFDVERIDILRGPQGTVYGRNATGGVVSTVTRSPTEEFESSGAVTLGNYNAFTAEAAVSGPIVSEKILGRIAFKSSQRDGFIYNRARDEYYNDVDEVSGRLKLRILPTEKLTVDLTADIRETGGFGPAWRTDRYLPGVPLPQEVLGGGVLTPEQAPFEINENSPHTLDAGYLGFAAKAKYEFAEFDLNSITAYREMENNSSYDIDGTDANFAELFMRNQQNQFTQEFTLVSNGEGSVDWVVGAFYLDELESVAADVGLYGYDPGASLSIYGEISTESVAAFGDATWHLNDRLAVEAGIRFGQDKRTLAPEAAYLFQDIGGIPLFTRELLGFDSSKTWDSITPRASIAYDISDAVTAYASVSTGFKAGSYNVISFQPDPYDNEDLVAYEVGYHASADGGRFKSNGALFFYDQTNLQQFQFDQTLGVVSNAAASEILGAEFDVSLSPVDGLDLFGSLSYLDATYSEFTTEDPAEPGGPDGNPSTLPNSFELAGNRLVNTPEWTANIGAQYTLGLGENGDLIFRGDSAYKSEVFSRPYQTNPRSDLIEDYWLTNLRVTYRTADERWSVAAFIDNLTDEVVPARKQTGAATLGAQINTVYVPPQMYGVRLSLSY
jgi:iron complex outermembrane receptor protein